MTSVQKTKNTQMDFWENDRRDTSRLNGSCTFTSPNESARIADKLEALSCSRFRAGFPPGQQQRRYIDEKGLDTIVWHACDFIRLRLASAYIPNDGRQTPMRWHPVFIA